MYLTSKKNDRPVTDHEELEVLLESFSKQVEEIVNEAENIEVVIAMSSCTTDADIFSRAMFNRHRKSLS